MIRTGILFTERHRLLSVAAILDVLETVNRFHKETNDEESFKITLLYSGKKPDNYTIHDMEAISEGTYFDLLLIPAFSDGSIPEAIQQNVSFLPWLCGQYAKGAEVGSCCSGAFLLASSGLLNNRSATTHINAAMAFKNAFPLVNLMEDAVITYDERLFTSGGATNTFHLLLTLIEKYFSRSLAVRTAKVFSIDMNRDQQAYFNTAPATQQHSDDMVKQVEREIEHHFNSGKNIEEIIKDVPASRRNLVRRFKKATGITPIEYLQKIRIESAKSMLEQSPYNIQAIMIESGYNDMKAFRMLFKKNVGICPKEYRNKFNGQKLLHVA